MSVEIELKFIVTPTAAAELPKRLASWPGQYTAPQKLSNIYYETPDGLLRRHDIGLRIRGFGDRYEMTVKTGGKAVGGLHQRPEYNIALTQPVLELERLPAEIWPDSLDIISLQQALSPLFCTDFMREKWVIGYQDSEIELALDRGEILAGDLREPLCELELELKSGSTADLLALAQRLAQLDGLRLGSLSKAARGYRLAQGNPPLQPRALTVLAVPAKASIEQGLVAGLELALNHWHYHEELWLQQPQSDEARLAIVEAIGLIRQQLVLFGGLIPRKASTDLRARLMQQESSLREEQHSAAVLCYSAAYLQAKLALTTWLTNSAWRPFVDQRAQTRLNGSFKRFADIMLGRCAADLKEAFGRSADEDIYQDRLQRLRHQIGSFYLLSGVYSAGEYQPYIAAWQALENAIVQRHAVWIEAVRKQAVSQATFWLNGTR